MTPEERLRAASPEARGATLQIMTHIGAAARIVQAVCADTAVVVSGGDARFVQENTTPVDEQLIRDVASAMYRTATKLISERLLAEASRGQS